MNDFTKEELEEIYYRLENAYLHTEEKIKFMIDNYKEESVNHNNKLSTLTQWLEFMIAEQKQLKVEHFPVEYEWNRGYLEALTDVKNEIMQINSDESLA
jgi:hypothetical protein